MRRQDHEGPNTRPEQKPPTHEPKPILRWAGSKKKLLPLLRSYCPANFATYIEPFAGSACLYFSIRPRQAILADFNTELIKTYRQVRLAYAAVHRELARFPRDESFYYRLRNKTIETASPRAAARFIYLNRYSFNGVYRTNRAGAFNVPRGTRTGGLPSLGDLRRCSKQLRTAKLLAGDFEATASLAGRNDFVYLDPPYSKGRSRGEYGYGAFSSSDLNRLSKLLTSLDARGAHFLMSYASTNEAKSLFRRWRIRQVRVRRHVAGFANFRRIATELIISNRQPPTERRRNR